MRLFEIYPGEIQGEKFSIWHLDLDHVVCVRDLVDSDGKTINYWLEVSGGQNHFITKALFDRIMRAWESK
jgi:hypothetical protein